MKTLALVCLLLSVTGCGARRLAAWCNDQAGNHYSAVSAHRGAPYRSDVLPDGQRVVYYGGRGADLAVAVDADGKIQSCQWAGRPIDRAVIVNPVFGR